MRWLAMSVACLLASCGNGRGAPCTMASDCQGGLACVSTTGASDGATAASTCMRLCDYDASNGIDQRLCADGTVCMTMSGMRVCYAGGGHAIRGACTIDTDCEAGTVCAPDTMQCAQACTVGTNTPCATGEACMNIGGGICRTISVVVDGGP